MPNYEQIIKQIEALGIKPSALPSSELKGLPAILREHECVRGIARGLYMERNGVLVATNERVIFFEKGVLWGTRLEEFRYENITSIQYTTGFIASDIIIYTAGNAAKIGMVPNTFCDPFVHAVREIISKQRAPESTMTSEDFLTKLERLAALKTAGLLSESEFVAAKGKLLDLENH